MSGYKINTKKSTILLHIINDQLENIRKYFIYNSKIGKISKINFFKVWKTYVKKILKIYWNMKKIILGK